MALGWKSNYLRYKSFFLNVAGQYQKKNELKMFMEVLLSLSAVAIFGLFAIKPTLTTIATLIKDMQGKRQTLALMDEKIENLNQARKVYDEEKAGIELLKTAIPKSGKPEDWIRQIEGVTSQNPVNILSITMDKSTILGTTVAQVVNQTDIISEEPMPDGANSLAFVINTSSDYSLMASFIKSLESLRRPFKLDSVYINTSQTAVGKNLILVINGRSPYLIGGE